MRHSTLYNGTFPVCPQQRTWAYKCHIIVVVLRLRVQKLTPAELRLFAMQCGKTISSLRMWRLHFSLSYVGQVCIIKRLSSKVWTTYLRYIYTAKLQLNKPNACDKETPFLDFNIQVVDDNIHTSVYDKCDDFGYPSKIEKVPRVLICYIIRLGKVIVLRHISDYGYIRHPFSRLLRHAGDTEDAFST